MNHDHHANGELPRELDWNFQRQVELHRERSRFTGRLVVLALLLSTFVLFRVLEPFHDLSAELEQKSGAAAELETTRADLAQRHDRQTALLETLAAVRGTLASPPWAGSVPELVRTIRGLNGAYQVLLETTDDELRAAHETREQTTDRVGALSRGATAFPASFRRQDGVPAHVPEFGEPARAGEPEAPAAKADAAGAPDESGGPAHDPTPESIGEPLPPAQAPAPGADRETARPSVAEALDALRVDPASLLGAESFRARDELLFRRLESRVQEEADRTILAVSGMVDASVLLPLEAAVADEDAEVSDTLTAAVADFRTALETWRTTNLGNRTWHETVETKSRAVDRLSSSLTQTLERTSIAVTAQQAATRKQREHTLERTATLEAEHERLKGELVAVEADLATILPGWLAGAFRTRDLFQLYPLLLVALVVLVAYNVWLVREHYLWVRSAFPDGRAQGEAHSLASLWTLVRRGFGGTTITLLSIAAALAVSWLAFERGTTLLLQWAALESTQPWELTRWSTDAGLWLGRAVFLAAAGGALLTLLTPDELREVYVPVDEADEVAPPRHPRRRTRAA